MTREGFERKTMDISIPATQPRLSRNLLIVPLVLLLAGGVLAACGGSKAASSAPAGPVATGSAVPSGNGGGNGAGGAAPAAYGLAAEITGSSIEVQDPATGQVTVSFTTSTAFSQTKTVTAAAIKVGGCVTAIGARTGAAGAGGTASPAPSSSGQRAAAPTSFTAASVAVSAAVNGSCAATAFGGGGFGGGGRGARPSGSARPTGARPSGSGGFGGGLGGGGFGAGVASGKVGLLSGSVMQVQVAARGNQPASVDTVTLAASTTYTETATVTSTALKVGECVSATGKADSTGTVAATRIALSTAGPNGCTTGFGRRPQASASSTGA
jgi:hypothetical protein